MPSAKRVLLVDDDKMLRTSLAEQLAAEGVYSIAEAASCEEARALATTEGPAKLAGERRLEHIEGAIHRLDLGPSPAAQPPLHARAPSRFFEMRNPFSLRPQGGSFAMRSASW